MTCVSHKRLDCESVAEDETAQPGDVNLKDLQSPGRTEYGLNSLGSNVMGGIFCWYVANEIRIQTLGKKH